MMTAASWAMSSLWRPGVFSIVGPIAGFVFGYVLAGTIGGIIGALAGYLIDRYRAGERRDRRRKRSRASSRSHAPGAKPIFDDPTATRRIAFATAIIVLGAKLAKADGQVTRDEVDAFKQRFKFSEQEVGGVAQIYDQAKASAEGFEPYARQIAALFGRDPVMLEELLIGLFEVARADGDLKTGEIEFLREVASIFGFDQAKFEQLRTTFSAVDRPSTRDEDPYKVLGVSRTMSDADIKKAYRNLVRELHPDQLMAKGLPNEFINRANGRLAAINAAYDRIEKQRNLK
ncbi:MAG: TerB family tellurite resistance protein [Pseudomonadota bacterium]